MTIYDGINVTLDIAKKDVVVPIALGRCGEFGIRSINVKLLNNGTPFIFDNLHALVFNILTKEGKSYQITDGFTNVNYAAGTFTFTFPIDAFHESGWMRKAYFSVWSPQGNITTADCSLNVLSGAPKDNKPNNLYLKEFDKYVDKVAGIYLAFEEWFQSNSADLSIMQNEINQLQIIFDTLNVYSKVESDARYVAKASNAGLFAYVHEGINDSQIAITDTPESNSVVRRTADGRIKASAGVDNDDLVTLAQTRIEASDHVYLWGGNRGAAPSFMHGFIALRRIDFLGLDAFQFIVNLQMNLAEPHTFERTALGAFYASNAGDVELVNLLKKIVMQANSVSPSANNSNRQHASYQFSVPTTQDRARTSSQNCVFDIMELGTLGDLSAFSFNMELQPDSFDQYGCLIRGSHIVFANEL